MTDEILRKLIGWSERQETVRAVLLTSTRAVPGATVDALSDYDVILVVRDIRPFVEDRRWIEAFGDVLVAYWDPTSPDPDSGLATSGNVVQYADGLKIDFSLWPEEHLAWLVNAPRLPAELDAGNRMLLDKDGQATGLRAPTYAGYIVTPPDEATYLTLINDFFVGPPYVAKCLLRDELLPARWVLDYDMRSVYLLPMLEWWVGCDTGWSVAIGVNGKGLKRKLPPGIWAEVETIFAGADIAGTWEALFRMIDLFRRIAIDVGACLGYAYPEAFDRRVVAFVEAMRGRAGDAFFAGGMSSPS